MSRHIDTKVESCSKCPYWRQQGSLRDYPICTRDVSMRFSADMIFWEAHIHTDCPLPEMPVTVERLTYTCRTCESDVEVARPVAQAILNRDVVLEVMCPSCWQPMQVSTRRLDGSEEELRGYAAWLENPTPGPGQSVQSTYHRTDPPQTERTTTPNVVANPTGREQHYAQTLSTFTAMQLLHCGVPEDEAVDESAELKAGYVWYKRETDGSMVSWYFNQEHPALRGESGGTSARNYTRTTANPMDEIGEMHAALNELAPGQMDETGTTLQEATINGELRVAYAMHERTVDGLLYTWYFTFGVIHEWIAVLAIPDAETPSPQADEPTDNAIVGGDGIVYESPHGISPNPELTTGDLLRILNGAGDGDFEAYGIPENDALLDGSRDIAPGNIRYDRAGGVYYFPRGSALFAGTTEQGNALQEPYTYTGEARTNMRGSRNTDPLHAVLRRFREDALDAMAEPRQIATRNNGTLRTGWLTHSRTGQYSDNWRTWYIRRNHPVLQRNMLAEPSARPNLITVSPYDRELPSDAMYDVLNDMTYTQLDEAGEIQSLAIPEVGNTENGAPTLLAGWIRYDHGGRSWYLRRNHAIFDAPQRTVLVGGHEVAVEEITIDGVTPTRGPAIQIQAGSELLNIQPDPETALAHLGENLVFADGTSGTIILDMHRRLAAMSRERLDEIAYPRSHGVNQTGTLAPGWIKYTRTIDGTLHEWYLMRSDPRLQEELEVADTITETEVRRLLVVLADPSPEMLDALAMGMFENYGGGQDNGVLRPGWVRYRRMVDGTMRTWVLWKHHRLLQEAATDE